jgi:hypothetical protein
VDDHGASVATRVDEVHERQRCRPEGRAGAPVAADQQGWHVTRVRAVRLRGRIVMPARGGEGRDAGSGLVDVEAVKSRRQAVDRDVHGERASARSLKADRPDLLPACVDERRTGPRGRAAAVRLVLAQGAAEPQRPDRDGTDRRARPHRLHTPC